jgi:hypothetical protein
MLHVRRHGVLDNPSGMASLSLVNGAVHGITYFFVTQESFHDSKTRDKDTVSGDHVLLVVFTRKGFALCHMHLICPSLIRETMSGK